MSNIPRLHARPLVVLVILAAGLLFGLWVKYQYQWIAERDSMRGRFGRYANSYWYVRYPGAMAASTRPPPLSLRPFRAVGYDKLDFYGNAAELPEAQAIYPEAELRVKKDEPKSW